MKIKVYVVDMEIPPRAKRWMLRLGLPIAVIFGGLTIAYAAVPKTWTTNEALKSADLNSNFANLDARLSTLENRGTVAAHARNCTTTIGTTDTRLVFSSEDYDTSGSYNNSTGEFTAPIAGKYRACAFVFGPGLNWTTGGTFALSLYKNGSKVEDTAIAYAQAPNSNGRLAINGCNILDLAATDVIDFRAGQIASAAPDGLVAPRNWVSFERIGN